MDWQQFRSLQVGDIIRSKRTGIYWIVSFIDQDNVSATEMLDAGRDCAITRPCDWEFIRRPRDSS